jgi:hypothetical protein
MSDAKAVMALPNKQPKAVKNKPSTKAKAQKPKAESKGNSDIKVKPPRVSMIQKDELTHKLSINHPKSLNGFMNAGSEVSSKEVLLKITKFLDWARADADTLNVLSVTYDMEQDLLAPDGTNALGNNAVISRVSRAKLFAYPRSANAANAETTFAVLTSVPVRAGGGNALLNAHQQSVIIPPTFTPKWHKVFDCNYDKLFSSSQVLPRDSGQFPLFNTSVVDVDDFSPLLGQAIQLKLEIHIAQTVPLRSNVLLGTAYQVDYVNVTSTASDQLAFVQVVGMANRT